MASANNFGELFAELNSCKYLFLRELNEPTVNSLRLVVEEGKVSPESTSFELGRVMISDAHSVVAGGHSALFEIAWDQYVAYSVMNEMSAVGDKSEKFELGNLVRLYSESKFLDYVQATWTHNDRLSQHIEIICEWHIIDVISTTVPTVKKLRSGRSD